MHGQNPTALCLMFNTLLQVLFNTHKLQKVGQPFFSSESFAAYAKSIHAHGAPLQHCFVTVRRIARPRRNRRSKYNGLKSVHVMQFQSVLLPSGLIASLSGPYEGKRQDSTMLYQSGLLPALEAACIISWQPTMSWQYCVVWVSTFTFNLGTIFFMIELWTS